MWCLAWLPCGQNSAPVIAVYTLHVNILRCFRLYIKRTKILLLYRTRTVYHRTCDKHVTNYAALIPLLLFEIEERRRSTTSCNPFMLSSKITAWKLTCSGLDNHQRGLIWNLWTKRFEAGDYYRTLTGGSVQWLHDRELRCHSDWERNTPDRAQLNKYERSCHTTHWWTNAKETNLLLLHSVCWTNGHSAFMAESTRDKSSSAIWLERQETNCGSIGAEADDRQSIKKTLHIAWPILSSLSNAAVVGEQVPLNAGCKGCVCQRAGLEDQSSAREREKTNRTDSQTGMYADNTGKRQTRNLTERLTDWLTDWFTVRLAKALIN